MVRFLYKSLITFLSICAVVSGPLAVAGTITFTENNFLTAPADTVIAGTGSSTATTVSGYRNISLTVGPFQSVSHLELIDGFSFDPSSQGAVTSASFSIDFRRTFTSNPGATQVVALMVVQQDGVTHNVFGAVTTSTSLVNFFEADITALFPSVDWVSGSEILFGFGGSVGTSSTGFTIDGGYDNFEVTVNFDEVAEPGAFAVFGFGILGLGYMRRRKAA